jgi:hydrogenase expression/formation protein HypE
MDELDAVVGSMEKAATLANVRVVAADTKVVPKGKADKVFINTSGIGVVQDGRRMPRKALPGDRVAVSGTVGEHGLVILASRLRLPLGPLVSDCGPVGCEIGRLYKCGVEVHMMRDPTRGGLATVLKEVALKSVCDVTVKEDAVPVLPEARVLADILGVDPLYLPCEGRVVAFIGEGSIPAGWTEIGLVTEGHGDVYLETAYGGTHRLGLFEGTPLPRIC